jgi:hypothetical protein
MYKTVKGRVLHYAGDALGDTWILYDNGWQHYGKTTLKNAWNMSKYRVIKWRGILVDAYAR